MKLYLTAAFLIISLTSFSQSTETFQLDWKKQKEWKQKSHQEQSANYLTEYLKKDETFENWKELIAIQRISAPGVMKVPLENLMNMGFSEFKKNAPDATLTLLEKNEDGNNPWIEYKSEAPGFNNDPNPESQFFHVVKTENAIFLIWWATKEAKISDENIKLFQEFFRSGKIK